MPSYGRETLNSVGRSIQVSADGSPEAKAGGVTVDWTTIAASGADATFLDEDFVATGEKFIRYGQILCKITASGLYGPYDSGASDGRQTITRGDCYIVNESMHMNSPHSDHPAVIDGGRIWRNRLIVGIYGGTNEVQTVTLGAGNTGGTFTITYSGQTTSALAYNATAADVKAALIALSNIHVGDVEVTQSGLVYTITFQGSLQGTNVAAVTTTPSLTGGANTAVVATATAGAASAGPSVANFEAAFPRITYVPE